MASISVYLQKIIEAVYGEEVRWSIHDSIAAMNDESSQAIKDSSDAKNSAKSFAAEAGKSATAAKTSETNASNSAAAAKTSETKAGESLTDTVKSATSAAESRDAARGYALLANSSQLNLIYVAEQLEKYVYLLSEIERTLDGFKYTEYLFDSSGAKVLDSMNIPISSIKVGFEAMLATLMAVQSLAIENRERINECFEEIAKLRQSLTAAPSTSNITDSSGDNVLDKSGAAISGTSVYLIK